MEARLVAVRPYLVDARRSRIDAGDAGALLDEAVRAVLASGSDRSLWLLAVAVACAYPTPEELRSARRAIRLAARATRVPDLLAALAPTIGRGEPEGGVTVADGATLVDAHVSATSRHNTGVQRVTRELSARWESRDRVDFVAWRDGWSGYRALSPTEQGTLLHWGEPLATGGSGSADLVLPVRCTVVVPEVSQPGATAPLAALAEHSPNRVVVVGHDTIPVVSGDTQAAGEIERFARFLAVVKHADRVVAVSESSAEEFAGFRSALAAQGLTGPDVRAVPLALDPPSGPPRSPDGDDPLVLVVGSQEPRKNHFAVLHAAERVAREGRRFRLRFLGGGSALLTRRFDAEVARLRRAGVAIEVMRGAGDAVLALSYAEARFTCFPSLHEGFGLPVAESLAMGVPCLTTGYGSTALVAAQGGCVVVDPRDDDALTDAFRALVSDDEAIELLRTEIAARPERTWQHYADEVWHAAMDGSTVPEPVAVQPGTPDAGAGDRARAAIEASSAAVAARRARNATALARARRAVGRPLGLGRQFAARSREVGLATTTRAAVDKVRRTIRRA